MGGIRSKSVPVSVVGRCHTRPHVDCSALMAPLLAAGDGRRYESVRPSVGGRSTVDGGRRLSHGIAMACRPPLFSVCTSWFGVMHRMGRTRGPTATSSSAVASRRISSMRRPASSSGRYRRRDGWHEGATSGRSARLDCAHPPSPAIVGTCRMTSTGSPAPVWPPTSPARGTSLDDGRPPATPTFRGWHSAPMLTPEDMSLLQRSNGTADHD
jgi:hypothetical protein